MASHHPAISLITSAELLSCSSHCFIYNAVEMYCQQYKNAALYTLSGSLLKEKEKEKESRIST